MEPHRRSNASLVSRTSISAPSAAARGNLARQASKSWIQDARRLESDAMHDAVEHNADAEDAKLVVNAVCRAATVLAVIIAVIKVYVYIKTRSSVVRTSALEGIGDVAATCIALYVSFRMKNVDTVLYPIGQHRFEPTGVLIFSVLMSTMMFANLLSCIEGLLERNEKEHEQAVLDFWAGMFGRPNYDPEGGGRIPDLRTHTNLLSDVWERPDEGLRCFLGLVQQTCSEDLALCLQRFFDTEVLQAGAMYQFLSTLTAEGQRGFDMSKADEHFSVDPRTGHIDALRPDEEEGNPIRFLKRRAALHVTAAQERRELWIIVACLGVCTIIKLSLYFSCTCIFIPRTGSTVLQALANDQRNDSLAVLFVIATLILGTLLREELGDWARRIDPMSAITLSVAIIRSWVHMGQEQVFFLCCPTVGMEVVGPLTAEVVRCISKPLEYEPSVRGYYTSASRTIEVDLFVADRSTPFEEVSKQMESISARVEHLEDMERCLIFPSSSR